MLAERLASTWGQNVFVDNRAGGGGVPGVMAGKDAAPDGYTLLMATSGTLGINPVVYSKLPYDAQADFAPASNVFTVPLVLVAHPSFGPSTVTELVAAAKRRARQDRFRVGRHRYRAAHDSRAAESAREHRHAARAVQGQQPRDERRDCGPGASDVRQPDSRAAAHPDRAGSGPSRCRARSAARSCPMCRRSPKAMVSPASIRSAGRASCYRPVRPQPWSNGVSADIRAILEDPAFRQKMIDRGGVPDPMTPAQYAAFIKSENEKWGEVAPARERPHRKLNEQ